MFNIISGHAKFYLTIANKYISSQPSITMTGPKPSTLAATATSTKNTNPKSQATASTSTSSTNAKKTLPDDPLAEPIRQTLGPSLYRLAASLPRYELDIIVKEARACESAL